MPEDWSSAPTEAGQPGHAGGATPLAPGTVVAETYQITRLLGQGGMGAVWEANHLRLPGKRVVIKVLLRGAKEPVMLARFRREAEIGSRLGHPHIVQVLDFNALPGGEPYIVLELLQGETLSARLRRGRIPLDEVKTIVSQVGSALQAAHREGIVHRDLKPDNIFLCHTDFGGQMRVVVKILDFGISKIRDANTVLTQDSALVGTPQYMAPEQATGANTEIDARTDIFALGAIVFEMLAGHPPFWGESLAAVVHAVVYAPTPALQQYAPDVPPGVASAVSRAMEKSPGARFPDVTSFVTTLTGGQSGPPSGAITDDLGPAQKPPVAGGTIALPRSEEIPIRTTPDRPRLAADRPRTGPAVRALIGLGVLGALGGGVWTWLRQQPPPGPPPTTTKIEEARKVESPPPPKVEQPKTVENTVKVEQPPRPAGGEIKKPDGAKRAEGSKGAGKSTSTSTASLSPAAAADLADAEAALAAGKPADALRLAQHSLYAQQSSAAYGVIARARCAQGDLGNAKAALAKVAARDRSAVVRACSKMGIELR